MRNFITKFLLPMGVPSNRTPFVSSALVVSFVVRRVRDFCCASGRNSRGDRPLVNVKILHLSGHNMHPNWGPWVSM